MRDFILLHVNGIEHRVKGAAATAPLSTYLRTHLGLVGTKLVCAEGDCGACTVLVGRPRGGRMDYEVVNSCIFAVHQADCTHVVTIEGLAEGTQLSPVQQAIVDGHGIQCGFCTPGFALALTGMFETARRREPGRSSAFGHDELKRGLCGNLCRCTGYLQLLEAGASIPPERVAPLGDRYAEAPLAERLEASARDEVRLEGIEGKAGRTLFMPTSLEAAIALRAAHPEATLVSGATDLGVEWNLGQRAPAVLIALSRVAGQSDLTLVDGSLVVGAGATWTQVAAALDDAIPQCAGFLDRFGSPQIRNVGTIGGNLAHASPIGDVAPLLLALDASLELAGPRGSRRIAIADFTPSYKNPALEGGELIARVIIPLPEQGESLRAYKVSKRRHFDLAIVNAGILVGHGSSGVTHARIGLGGVGPIVQRLPETEASMVGQPFALETFQEAGRVLRSEIRPISDLRGSEGHRLQLAENLLSKFYLEVAREGEVVRHERSPAEES